VLLSIGNPGNWGRRYQQRPESSMGIGGNGEGYDRKEYEEDGSDGGLLRWDGTGEDDPLVVRQN